MSLIAKQTGGNYKPAPAGSHVAVCIGVVDVGTQVTPFKDKRTGLPKHNHQVRIAWELPDEKMEDGRPYTISSFFTLSLHEKANLRKTLESWRGRQFTMQELAGFDLKNVLGKACLLSITHKKTEQGDTKAGVSAVMALPKGTPVPKQTNPSTFFDIEEWDQAVFDSLPDWLKVTINNSDEARERWGELAPGSQQDGDMPPFDANELPADSEIPF